MFPLQVFIQPIVVVDHDWALIVQLDNCPRPCRALLPQVGSKETTPMFKVDSWSEKAPT